jgi:AraC-like DNA-binding protein
MEASEEKPYLSMSLYLDTGLIATLASKNASSLSSHRHAVTKGAAIQDIDPDLLDAFLRLAELAENPQHMAVMEELLIREIHYRLLASPFGPMLCRLNTIGSQSHQITHAIVWLKENYKQPLRIEKMASQTNMAPSTFHKYFKDITTLSPLQYQKRLRLGEAQRLMLSEGYDVAQAAFSVGYESATQFIREYKRLFGKPPRKNVTYIKSKVSENIEEVIP